MNGRHCLTPEEYARDRKVSVRTIYRLIKAGKIPAERIGHQWSVSGTPQVDNLGRTEHIPHDGGVYFVAAAGLVKIGLARSFRRRFIDLQSILPIPLRVLGVVRVSDAGERRALERCLHQRFAAHHQHGEWYAPTLELRAFIAVHGDPL